MSRAPRYAEADEREYERARRRYDDEGDRFSRSIHTTGLASPENQRSERSLPLNAQEEGHRYTYPTAGSFEESRTPPRQGYSSYSQAQSTTPSESRSLGYQVGQTYRPGPPSVAPSLPSRSVPPETSTRSDSRTDRASNITETIEKLKLTSFYVRPGYGEQGKPLTVLANFFMVRSKDKRAKIIYHYDVEMDPVVSRGAAAKKPKGLLRAVWEQLCLQENSKWVDGLTASAYDGRKNAFTPNKLPIPAGQAQSFEVAISPEGVVQRPGPASSSDEENRRWRVTLKLVAEVDLQYVMDFCQADKKAPTGEEECLTGLMATNVLIRDLPSKKYAQVGATGNKFFSMSGAVPIPQGAVVCRGFMQSFRYSSCGLPLLNLDIGFSAFLAAGPALEVIAKIISRGPNAKGRGIPGAPSRSPGQDIHQLTDFEVATIKRVLRGAKFTVMHRASSRLHTILSVTLQPAESITFLIQGRDGGEDKNISIPEYYKQFHGAPVTKPRLPCVQYGKKAFIPLEFVRLAEWNSLPPTKLTAEQTAAMIKVSAVAPKERGLAVANWRTELSYEKQEKIAAWGLQVNSTMVQINARILPPPRIVYANGLEAMPSEGGWNLRGKRFFRNGKKPLVAWSVVSFDKYIGEDEMQRYVVYLCKVLSVHGVNVKNMRPDCIGPIDPRQSDSVKFALQSAARAAYIAGQCAPQLICCVLPGRDAWLYEQIKKSSFNDLKGPVPTQCMQAAKIRNPRGIDAYTGNLVMKILNKLGGLPHQVPMTELPGMIRGKTMLLGGDLGLPPIKAGNENAPTVACTIATYTADCDAYSAQIRLQDGRGEIILDLATMIEEHLKIFKKHNGDYPERVLVFRDGISEGQYAAALHYEHQAIMNACKKLERNYRPKILMCICAKKHSTRFFGRDNDVDRTGNLPSGLVVDKGVTHPYAYDFFLQAHAGRVGTARPTHYICLLDELAMSPDQLQQLVNSLCYTFSRCTRSVSLVPVCYIADLVCQKARIIVHEPGTSIAPSESSAGRSGVTSSRRGGALNLDIMQVQKVLMRNEELSEVAWWM